MDGTLAFCGIYCGECKNYRQNMNCAGCRTEEKLIDDCTIRVCAAKFGYFHCGECGQFPCEELNEFYNDGKASHLKAYYNLLEMRESRAGHKGQ